MNPRALAIVAGLAALLFGVWKCVAPQNPHTASRVENPPPASPLPRDAAAAIECANLDRPDLALAHLARACRHDPHDSLATALLYSTLRESRSAPTQVSAAPPGATSPDATRALKLNADGTATLVDANTGTPLGPALRHGGAITSAQFTADAMRVLTTDAVGRVRVWDAFTGKNAGSHPRGDLLRHTSPVRSAAFSPDASRVLTRTDETAQLWDTASGQPVGVPIRHEGRVRCAAFSPDGRQIITGGDDNAARVWSAFTSEHTADPLMHEGPVRSASFSADNATVFTTSDDRTARVWHAASGEPVGRTLRHLDSVHTAAFNADVTMLVTGSADWTARIWDVATGRALCEPLTHTRGKVVSAIFSPDGSRILTASSDKTARLWKVPSGAPLGEPLPHSRAVVSAVFSADGKRVVTASLDGTSRIWDATTAMPLGPPLTHTDAVRSAVFSADGAFVLTASQDRTARLWHVATAQQIGAPFTHGESVQSAAFSADGKRIVTACLDGTARIWDAGPAGDAMPAWFPDFAEQLGGLRLENADDTITPVPPLDWEKWRGIINENAGDDSWTRLAKWLGGKDGGRTINPVSTRTTTEFIAALIEIGTPSALAEAYDARPGDPVVLAAFAAVVENKLTAGFLCRHAVESAPASAAVHYRVALAHRKLHQKSEASAAITEALRLDPGNAIYESLRTALASDP